MTAFKGELIVATCSSVFLSRARKLKISIFICRFSVTKTTITTTTTTTTTTIILLETIVIAMQCNLKASRSGLILAKFVLYACAETAIFELPFEILILLLDLATGFPIWCRYFGDRWIKERLACLDLDTLECRRIKHDKITHNLTLWPISRYYNMSVHSRHTRLTECRSDFYIYSSLLSYCRLSK